MDSLGGKVYFPLEDKTHVSGEVLQLCFKCSESLVLGGVRVVWLQFYRCGGADIIDSVTRRGPFV